MERGLEKPKNNRGINLGTAEDRLNKGVLW